MKKRILLSLFIILIVISFVSAEEPMILRNIKEIKSVSPFDVANLGFGVYQVSAQYNLGAYHQGKWYGEENRRSEDKVSGAVWVEFSWNRPETNVVLIDGLGNERKIYLPASTSAGNSTYAEYYWISEDGSSYYANTNHAHGWPNLDYEQALVPEHLARKSLSPEQKNPEAEEPPELPLEERGKVIKIKGKLVDGMTNEPIADARLNSAYEFSPDEVVTDANGSFEFIASADFGGAWAFLDKCHGWADNIVLQKNYEFWESGQLKYTYGFALRKDRFDAEEDVIDVTGKSEIDIGKAYAWPQADISIISDIKTNFRVMYKYKNKEGYNGPGQRGYTKEHYLTNALPLDYDVFIQFEDEQGNQYKSSTYHVSKDAFCNVVTLRYFNGESEWSLLSKIQPDEETGPIEIPKEAENIPEETLNALCNGCLEDNKCYPFGYIKSGEYCSIDNDKFTKQLKADSTCENNFECESNVCIGGECISESLIKRIVEWFKRLFGGE